MSEDAADSPNDALYDFIKLASMTHMSIHES